MSKVKYTDGPGLRLMCPGCNMSHRVGLAGSNGPQWAFNGDCDAPTLSPSVLVRCHIPGDAREPEDPPEVCHSFVRDGKIEFLGDCTHALAGQTVELPELPK